MTGRVVVAAYDVRQTSPMQPRLAAVAHEARGRGLEVELWAALEPGPWAEAAGVSVRVVADPIGLVRRGLGAVRRGLRAPRAVVADSVRKHRRQSVRLFPDDEIAWSMALVAAGARRLGPGDTLMTWARPESLCVVGRLAQLRGARWWADFGDGWCFEGLRPEAMRPGLRRRLELRAEAWGVGAADGVSTVNRRLADYFDGLRPGRPVVVFENVVPREFEGQERKVARREGLAPSRLRLAHLGRLSHSDPTRTAAPLARLLEGYGAAGGDLGTLGLSFRGDLGVADHAQLDALRALGVGVEALPPLPREELGAWCADVDGLVVIAAPGKTGTTAKLLDALGLERPVLLLAPLDSEGARLVVETEAGTVIDVSRGVGAEELERWRSFVERCLGPSLPPRTPERLRASVAARDFLDAVLAAGS